MLHCDASPAIAPATPAVKPSSAPTISQAKEASGPSAMEVDSGASTEGGASTPQKPFEFPKIVYPALTPSNTTLVPGGVSSSPTCGIEELLRQADILQGNSISFGKLLAEISTNLKIIALVNFTLPFAFHMSIPL